MGGKSRRTYVRRKQQHFTDISPFFHPPSMSASTVRTAPTPPLIIYMRARRRQFPRLRRRRSTTTPLRSESRWRNAFLASLEVSSCAHDTPLTGHRLATGSARLTGADIHDARLVITRRSRSTPRRGLCAVCARGTHWPGSELSSLRHHSSSPCLPSPPKSAPPGSCTNFVALEGAFLRRSADALTVPALASQLAWVLHIAVSCPTHGLLHHPPLRPPK